MAKAPEAPTTGSDEVLRRRPLVPTERQAEVGDVHRSDAGVVGTVDTGEDRPSWHRRARTSAGSFVRNADPRSISGPKLPLIILAITGTISQWDDLAFGVVAPDIRAEFGFSLAFIAGLGALMQVMGIALALPFGYLSDRVKRVWIVRIGTLTSSVAGIAQGLAPGLGQLVGARVVSGAAASSVGPTNLPLMTDYFAPSARTRVFSFFFAAGYLGLIVGPALVGLVGSQYGWRAAIVALGSAAFVAALLTFFLKEPVRGEVDRRAMGADPEVAAHEPEPVGFVEAYRTVAKITTLRRFWYAAPFTVLGTVGSLTLLNFYYAEVFVLGIGARGVIASVTAGLALLGLLFFGPLGDRILSTKPSRLITIAAVMTLYQAGSFVALAVAPNVYVAVAVGIPSGVVAAILTPAFFTLISMIVPARMRGMGMQTQRPWELLGVIAIPFVVAIATEAFGLKIAMVAFAPPLVIAAAIIASTASSVDDDIRNAKIATMAEAEAERLRRDGSGTFLLCRGVNVDYDGVQVLFDVDLDVEDGEIVALLGTNGAGKSTLLKAIAGVQEASSGAIFLDGLDITHRRPHETTKLGVVVVPGGQAIFPHLTVDENIRAAFWLNEGGDRRYRVVRDEVLDFFPVLRDRLDQEAGTLSGGEQQMVALSQAFIMEPRLLMIDELSLGLAPAIVEQLLVILREIHARGTTVIVVEQSVNVAMTIAERVVFMEKGQVRFSGSTDDLLARPDLLRSVFIGGGAAGGPSYGRGRTSSTPDRSAVLEARDVAVSYGGVRALQGVDVAVAAGEIVGIIGPNGAGKTTLFDIISGYVPPDRGTVELNGVNVTRAPEHVRAQLGLARSFQNARLFSSLSVRENIAVFLDRQANQNPVLATLWAPQVRRSEKKIARRVDDLIELLGLEAYADKSLGELSTGSRRVVDVACMLAARPKILLLDEPSSGLAQAETEALGPLLLRIVRETGCGALVIEHDMPLVSSISDRLVAMELGQVIATGSPRDVLNDPGVRSAYLSASEDTVARSGPMAAIARALEVHPDE